jgi:gamma-glutamylcyclotransferase (GGCT)/AIG2-like uncharacterized protein YtfP
VTPRLFAYGTLLLPEVMAAVAGRRLAARPALLRGFARRAVRGEVYPGLVREPGAVTRGVLYERVDPALWARLDRFEGPLYERRDVSVTQVGRARRAATYVVRADRLAALAEAPWDPEAFARRHAARYVAGCRAWARGDLARIGSARAALR